MEPELGFVRVGNAKLYYEVAGQGQTLVLIHAGIADSRQWNDDFGRLVKDFRVLRYDRRGFGQSVPVEGEFSHLADLVALLDQLGLEEPLVLIGSSMGGTLAMDFALDHTYRVKALVMVGSAPSGLELDVTEHPAEAEAEKAYEAGDLDLLAELEVQIFFDGMGRTADHVNQEMRALVLEMNRLALAHQARQLGTRLPDTDTPAVERLVELDIPVLVVVGEHDEPYAQAAADYMVDRIPSAYKVTIPDAAHLPNMEYPAQFQRIVHTFLVIQERPSWSPLKARPGPRRE